VERARGGTRRKGRGMRLTSTRAPRPEVTEGPGISLSTALLRGLAPDGGLYVPSELPRVEGVGAAMATARTGHPDALAACAGTVIGPFLDHPDDAPLRAALSGICRRAFPVPIPLRPLEPFGGAGSGQAALLELFHGPTGAFKDFAARFLAAALEALGTPRHLLVATSGDTGSAVAAAFAGRPGFRVTVLFPAEGVSPRQAHLLSCFGEAGNVASYRVEGSFDDAQRMVKSVLADPVAVDRHGLTSANSISLGRLLPQLTWFAHHAAHWHARTGRRPGFIVPSGNFGHGLAALWARGMGFPVGAVHLATNRNRALVDWIETGRAAPRESVRTPANAMDVGVPSNLERLSWMQGRWTEWRSEIELSATSVSDAEILACIETALERHGVVPCPHTACGLVALERLRQAGDGGDWIVAGTAHPAKFPEVVEPRLGAPVEVPPALARLLARPARSEALAAGSDALVDALDRVRTA
jgi:threonine synthase